MPRATKSISGDFLHHMDVAIRESIAYVNKGSGVRHGLNGYTPHAFPAYISAVAFIEARINEGMLGSMTRAAYSDSPLWSIREEVLEKMELKTKMVIIPHLLFGKSFCEGEQPFQDFAKLVKVRNDSVHYKMGFKEPKYLTDLVSRGIAISHPSAKSDGADYPWPSKLSTLQGIIWARNVACRIITDLVELAPPDKRTGFDWISEGLTEIDPKSVKAYLKPEDESESSNGA